MNTRCPFNSALLSFAGDHLEQARCLLRSVKRGGNVDDTPAALPAVLQQLLAAPQLLNLTVAQLRAYLGLHGISEASVGGSLDEPVSRADTNNPSARLAQYFVIHDTSSKLAANQSFDPNFINSAQWSGNRLAGLGRGLTHIYITRLGETLTDRDYRTPWRATRFEQTQPGALLRGLFLHHELIQPRKGPGSSDIDSPTPGFTQVQYERLALQYLIASVRRGSWLIPGFHCVIDLGVGDHDDPQQFDLAAWGIALSNMLEAVRGPDAIVPHPPAARLRSRLLAVDAVLQAVAAGNQVLGPSQIRALAGVGPLQDGLNLLADHGEPGLRIPGALPENGSRGFYGGQTRSAVTLFQTLHHLVPADGNTGRDTILALDAALLEIELEEDDDGISERNNPQPLRRPAGQFTTPATSSTTENGRGGSTTSGLNGQVFHTDDGAEIIDASETVTAKRGGQSLGDARSIRQVRTKQDGTTTVHQPDYCWGRRILPDAVLMENHPGFGANGAGVFTGRATFFGKSDDVDEGTGSPIYGMVQTNSSVFGVSLKRARLLSEGLAAEDDEGVLHPTEKGLRAKIEIFFPETGRMVSLPLVDVGPAPRIPAIADLTVAASVFLQKLTEDEVTKPNAGNIANIPVQARIVA